jgi:tRNA (guanine37-N1)-methyltransferase
MTITILTLFPGLFDGFLQSSILARAIARGLIAVKPVDIRDYASGRHRVCDDAAYGGGPGMVMKPEPIAAALEANGAEAAGGRAGAGAGGARGRRVVYLTPAGRLYTQGLAAELAREEELLLLCGRYEGVDQRVIDAFVTDEVSIGDYVLSGGEVPAMVVVDSIARLLPGVITGDSLEEESFASGLLEYPHYTRPEVFRGMGVPDVLLSGHHEKIRQWRLAKSIEKTMKHRPELLDSESLPVEARELLGKMRREGVSDERSNQGA